MGRNMEVRKVGLDIRANKMGVVVVGGGVI